MSFTVHPIFEHYHQPSTIDEAVSLLAQCGKDARLLAGGTVLINQMKSRAVTPRHVININHVHGLNEGRVKDGGQLSIGALATLAAVAKAAPVEQGWPLLREAILEIGVVQQRNLGTVVGNICRPVASADTAVALLALDALVVMRGVKGSRDIAIADFLAGPRRTMITDSEMVTGVRIPPLPAQATTAFVKLAGPKVNAAALLQNQGGALTDVRIAVGGVAATPIRLPTAEAALRGKRPSDKLIDEAAEAATHETNPGADLRASSDYRREMARVLVGRALKTAWERASKKGR